MATVFKKARLATQPNSDRAQNALSQVIHCLNDAGIAWEHHVAATASRDDPDCDLVIVIGGDGTLMHVARDPVSRHALLLGINTGRLGFLVDVFDEEIEDRLPAILTGDHTQEMRYPGLVRLVRGKDTILTERIVNEATVQKKALSLCELEAWVNGAFLLSQRGDGLIMATPTGSTAYALSCNGPIVHPSLPVTILVPIASHQLTQRPLVVNSDDVIEIHIPNQEDDIVLTGDGRILSTLQQGDKVLFNRAPEPLQFLHPSDYDYFRQLHDKLSWGRRLC